MNSANFILIQVLLFKVIKFNHKIYKRKLQMTKFSILDVDKKGGLSKVYYILTYSSSIEENINLKLS